MSLEPFDALDALQERGTHRSVPRPLIVLLMDSDVERASVGELVHMKLW